MKWNKFFMLGVAGLALCACSNEDGLSGAVDDGTSKTMVVSIAGIGSASTKATNPSDKWSPDTDAEVAVTNINKLTLLFTDASGVVKYKYEGDKANESTTWNALFGTGVKFVGLTGVTAVHAIANLPSDVTINVDGNVNELKTAYTKQGLSIEKTGVVYVGSDKDITPFTPEPAQPEDMPEEKLDGAGEEGNFYYSASIQLKPIISRIQINSIKVKTSGSVKFGPEEDNDKYTLTWSNFKPTLNGIYLNNIATEFTDFLGTVNALAKNDSYMQNITGGTWLLNSTDYTADAAYVSYTDGSYGSLLGYGTEDKGVTPLTIGENKSIAFNIFVPFDVEDVVTDPSTGGLDKWASTNNPTIHFQFANDVTGYTTTTSLTAGGELTEEDKEFIETAETNIDYTLPEIATGGYLFANISKLYSDNSLKTELQLQAGKIYNMDVEISPVNMTIDLDNPDSYNVVVKVTVLPFTEQTIYPGLD